MEMAAATNHHPKPPWARAWRGAPGGITKPCRGGGVPTSGATRGGEGGWCQGGLGGEGAMGATLAALAGLLGHTPSRGWMVDQAREE